MRNVKVRILLVCLILIGIMSCSKSTYKIQTDAKFRKRTETVSRTMQVTKDMSSMNIELKGKLTRGAMSWQVLGPAGAIRWEEEVQGNFSKTKTFKPQAGDWELILNLKEAAGHYSLQWTAQ